MCGIVGFYSDTVSVSQKELEQAAQCIRHRGPDHVGIFYKGSVGLAHVRLSILDLTPSAHQPMSTENGKLWIIYNGETYNYKELVGKYRIATTTRSDTEVILKAFELRGTDVFTEMNSMHALAIYNHQDNTIILSRDRVGKKPLYYYLDNKFFAFASEIKSLLCFSYIKQRVKLNTIALNYYLHLGFIPEPLTIYSTIHKFPASSYALFSNGKLDIKRYWSLAETIKESYFCDEKEAKERLHELIVDAVKKRLISDVPYGIFLSGGTDSSLIAAIAQQQVANINTYSIGFNEATYNEASYARSIANYLKTKHTEYTVTFKDALSLIEDMVCHYDEPYADASAIPTMLISKLAKEKVSMVLSGDGGDELFWGYGAYRWAKRLNNPIVRRLRKPIATLLSLGNSRYKRVSNLFKWQDVDFLPAHILSQEQYFYTIKESKELLNKEYFYKPEFLLQMPVNRPLTDVELQSFFDFHYYLKDDLMVKTDRASMRYGLEVRSPLLDYRIVEFAYNVCPSLKHQGNTDKYLLKQILYDYLPPSFFNRPKWGFALPISYWLNNELSSLVEQYLISNNSLSLLVNMQKVKELKKRYHQGDSYLYGRLWNLLVLGIWLQKQDITLFDR